MFLPSHRAQYESLHDRLIAALACPVADTTVSALTKIARRIPAKMGFDNLPQLEGVIAFAIFLIWHKVLPMAIPLLNRNEFLILTKLISTF